MGAVRQRHADAARVAVGLRHRDEDLQPFAEEGEVLDVQIVQLDPAGHRRVPDGQDGPVALPAGVSSDAPEEALRRFLLMLVEHAAVGKGMAVALESIMATNSPIFGDARTQMAQALDQLLQAGTAAVTIRGDVSGRTLLRALGGICGMHATEGWQNEAVLIAAILFDGLRFGAQNSDLSDQATTGHG